MGKARPWRLRRGRRSPRHPQRLRYVGRVLSPRRIHVVVVVAAVVVAGCSDDELVPTDKRPALTQTAPAAKTAPTETAPATAPPAQTVTPPGPACGALGELRLLRVGGQAGCDEVRRVAAGYDVAGGKVQEIAGWTCASGTAQTRPVVFTCTRGAAEFVARQSRG